MIEASVGFQCPECVREGNQGVRRGSTAFGGRVSNNPGYVSKVIIGLNVLVYLGQLARPALESQFWLIGANPPPPGVALEGVAAGEVYRLLTAAFLHGGIVHLLLNMVGIFLFGPPVEAALGRLRFSVLYLVSALGGSAASYAFNAPNNASVGASGALFGLLGAFFVVNRKLGRDASGVLVLLAINLVYGFIYSGIDWRAHLGGLASGMLCAVAMVYAPRERRTLFQVVGTALVLGAIVAVVALRTMQLT
jgi:membrane associated rhomboid family serine protease